MSLVQAVGTSRYAIAMVVVFQRSNIHSESAQLIREFCDLSDIECGGDCQVQHEKGETGCQPYGQLARDSMPAISVCCTSVHFHSVLINGEDGKGEDCFP